MGSIPDGLYLPPSDEPEMLIKEYKSRSVKLEADLDFWIVRHEVPIGFMPTSASLIADTSCCPPGYARVKLNTSAEQVLSRDPVNKILTSTVVDGEIFMQFNYKHLLISDFGFAVNDPNVETMIHGPAINVLYRNTGASFDNVPVLICKEWPELGQRWERRQRHSGWPSPEFISDLKKLGCDFVQVPSHNSTHPEVEWRIAFSLIEQKLCQSFTTVQRQCFLIAKVIMKRNLESCEEYSTYLLKTSMFWMMEGINSTDWQDENALARFIILLFEKFQSFLKNGNLPHYFIEKRNLIGHIHKNICEEMIEKTDRVCNSLHIHILLHCYCLFPVQDSYISYKEHLFSLFHTTLNYSPDVRLILKQRILRLMLVLLAMYNNIGLLVYTLKQHGYILDPQVHHPASTCGDEKTWILQKVGGIFTDLDVLSQNFLSQRLSGMLCLYYYHLYMDDSLLKSAFNHLAHALNHFCHGTGTVICVDSFTLQMSQPELYIWQVLALKASGEYQQALDIIRFVRNNDQWNNNKECLVTIPSKIFRLIDTLIDINFRDSINPWVHDIAMYLNVQLLVLMDRFNEADSVLEYWRIHPPSYLLPSGHDKLEQYIQQMLTILAFIWASNFTEAAQIFESMHILASDLGRAGNIRALCKALSVVDLGGTCKSHRMLGNIIVGNKK